MLASVVCLVLLASSTSGLSALAAPTPALGKMKAIQPGAPFFFPGETSDGPAAALGTLGFVFAGRQGELYIEGPAHGLCGEPQSDIPVSTGHPCPNSVGMRVGAPGVGEFGTVVLHVSEYWPNFCAPTTRCIDDYALILIDKSKRDLVSPSVRHWGGPTGTTTNGATSIGDELLFYGQGQGAREAALARTGILLDDDRYGVTAALAFSNGDSGGPLLHARTGAALAMFGVSPTTGAPIVGVTVERLLEVARAAGFDLRLRTSPLASQPN